jgi:ATP phosphoribosyltransferase regulatory subunit
MGNTFINNSSYRGRLKECTDAGAECIGDDSIMADAEIIAMVITALKACGLEEFQIDIGHSGFLTGLMEGTEIDEDVKEEIYTLLKNKNFFALESLVMGLHLDDSIQKVLSVIQQFSGSIEQIEEIRSLLSNSQSIAAIDRIMEVYKILGYYDYQKYISFDLSMVTEYRYYTGIIFNGYTYGTGDAIVSGGRYDSLMKQFGADAPSVGFKISVDGLMTAMSRQKIAIASNRIDTLLVYDANGQEKGIQLAMKLREDNVCLQTQCCHFDIAIEDILHYAKENQFQYVLCVNETATRVKVIHTQDSDEHIYELETFTKEDIR